LIQEPKHFGQGHSWPCHRVSPEPRPSLRKRYIGEEQKMLTRAKILSLAMAVLLVLILMSSAPTGYAQNRPFGKLWTWRDDHRQ